MLKKKCTAILLFVMIQLTANASQVFTNPDPFVLFTVPKSGSHLLIKTLHFMTGFTPFWQNHPCSIEDLYQNNRFAYTHCCLSAPLLEYYSQVSEKQILGIRDLRDVCVSLVFHIRKGIWPQFTGQREKIEQFNALSFDEQLLFVIHEEYELNPPHIVDQLAMSKVANQAAALAQDPQVLICRYEDIVGPEGGGSLNAQREILQKIAAHIGIDISASQLDVLASRLYGNIDDPFNKGDFKNYQSTFREGKMGGWKRVFTPSHKEAFKRRLGSALIALGYEKDDNW